MGPRLKDVEDCAAGSEVGYVVAASMGPRLKDVEDVRSESTGSFGSLASMGPRLKDVEDKPVHFGSVWVETCFNGATSQGRGRRS